MKINLQFKIIGIVFLLSFILFSVLTYTYVGEYRTLLEETYTAEAKAIANALDANIRNRADLENKSLLQANIYKHIWLNPNIFEININMPTENGGLVTYFSNEQTRIGTVPDPDNVIVMQKDILLSKIMKIDDVKLLRVITPIHLSGQTLGTYQIDLTLENIDKTEREAIKAMFLYYILIILGFVILLFLFSKTITKPIETLMITAQAIAAGNLSKRAVVKSRDEIGELAKSFNKMVENLLSAEKYNQRLVNTMPTSLIVVNPDATIRSVNPSTLNLLGYTEQELNGKSVTILFDQKEKESIFVGDKFNDLIKKGFVKDVEMIYKTKNKKEIEVGVSASVMKDEKGKMISIVIAAKDMSVYKELEKERIAAEKEKRETAEKSIEQLKELDRMKDDFLNVTAHELRTPLFPIKSQTEVLLSGEIGAVTDEQRESLEMIKRNAERLYGLIIDVLDISKIKSEKLRVLPEKINLNEIIRNVVEELTPEAEKKDLELTITEPLELPETMADSKRIIQVISNLINNAIKFTLERGKIIVEAKVEKENIRISVTDTGIGISKENIRKLFIPFSQVESGLIREQKGTGLGLAIAKGIIEAHDGKIWVESEGEGRGVSIILTLPIAGPSDHGAISVEDGTKNNKFYANHNGKEKKEEKGKKTKEVEPVKASTEKPKKVPTTPPATEKPKGNKN